MVKAFAFMTATSGTDIFYLDSPSDYRECLPQDRHWSSDGHRLEMRDSPKHGELAKDLSGSLAAVLFLFAGLIACLLSYSVLR